MTAHIRFKTYCTGDHDILSKDNTLDLDDEEIDELLHILDGGLESLLWNGVIISWTERRDQSSRKNQLAHNLSGSSGYHQRQKPLVWIGQCLHTPNKVRKTFEQQAEGGQITSDEDGDNDDQVRKRRGTRMFPLLESAFGSDENDW